MAEYSGRGDPTVTLSLLWGQEAPARRGRKPGLTPAQVGAAALAIADAQGLQGLSMRVLSEALGVSTMALYRYVPGKAELLDLIIDLAYAELPDAPIGDAHWTRRLESVARDEWKLYLAHPWLLEVSTYRAALGPHGLRKYERELQAIAGAGLGDLEMDLAIASLSGFVRGAARSAIEGRGAFQHTGQTNEAWWAANAALLAKLVRADDFPLASRVGTAVGQAYGGVADPQAIFEFGLARHIDGIRLLARAEPA